MSEPWTLGVLTEATEDGEEVNRDETSERGSVEGETRRGASEPSFYSPGRTPKFNFSPHRLRGGIGRSGHVDGVVVGGGDVGGYAPLGGGDSVENGGGAGHASPGLNATSHYPRAPSARALVGLYSHYVSLGWANGIALGSIFGWCYYVRNEVRDGFKPRQHR